MWLHPIYVVQSREPAQGAIEKLAPAIYQQIELLSGGVFAAGIGRSVVALTPGSAAATPPVRITELHWAHYALHMEMDRQLLEVLNDRSWSSAASMRMVEADVDYTFALYRRIDCTMRPR